MSYNDYITGRAIAAKGYSFYALIQAAMRQADTDNLTKLHTAWPKIWLELRQRYDAPGGLLADELEENLAVGVSQEFAPTGYQRFLVVFNQPGPLKVMDDKGTIWMAYEEVEDIPNLSDGPHMATIWGREVPDEGGNPSV